MDLSLSGLVKTLKFFVQYLDLTDSPIDNVSCEIISEMTSLLVLKLDHCSVETAGAAQILLRLKKLIQFECNNQLQNMATKELL